MADSKNTIHTIVLSHIVIQLTFLLVRIPSLILTLSTIASFYSFFALPAVTSVPPPIVDTIYLAAYILIIIAFFLATLSDLIALYFAVPFRNPLCAISTRHLSARIRLEKVTYWLLVICSATVFIYPFAAPLADPPSYQTLKRCRWLLIAMFCVRILFVMGVSTLELLVEECEKFERGAKLAESGEEC